MIMPATPAQVQYGVQYTATTIKTVSLSQSPSTLECQETEVLDVASLSVSNVEKGVSVESFEKIA